MNAHSDKVCLFIERTFLNGFSRIFGCVSQPILNSDYNQLQLTKLNN